MHLRRDTVEDGEHELHRAFGDVTLTRTKLNVPGAWTCSLPDGKRVIGEQRTVRETVERITKKTPFWMRWLLRTQERWAEVLPDDLVSAQSENEFKG